MIQSYPLQPAIRQDRCTFRYDREEDAKSLRRKLIDGSTNVVLYAPRRYGKTSLVLKVLEQLSVSDGIKGMCFDLTRVPTVERFCEEYANSVYALFGGRKELVHKFMDYLSHLHPVFSVTGEVKFDYGTRMSATSISEVLDLPERLSHDLGDIPIAIAFDEFQEVADISREFPLEKIFRSCIQAHRNVRYVFLGSKTHLVKRMFGDATRPFYNAALPMPLKKPPMDASLDFLLTRFRDSGLSIASEVAGEILSVSENIPYYLQAIAAMTFERVAGSDRKGVESGDVEATAAEFVGINSELYEERLAGLSDAKRAIIEALAKEPVGRFTDEYRTRHALPVTSTLHTALAELTDAGLVEKTESVIRVSDPFFTRYILKSAAAVFA